MMDPSFQFKNILVIRPDNMGDLLMSQPAIRALKETFKAKITVLVSVAGAAMAALMPEADEVIVTTTAWVKNPGTPEKDSFTALVKMLAERGFDAAFLFTVYSQNPLPSAMLAYLAGIPHRFAYCRENPYHLLTHWLPDPEPYRFIRHQVQRDLELVKFAGAYTTCEALQLVPNKVLLPRIHSRLEQLGVNTRKPWILMHTGVSETRRRYPAAGWIDVAKRLSGYQLIFTGSVEENSEVSALSAGAKAFNAAGLFDLEEFITLIAHAALLISVNTSAMHIAAATHTPVIALYAMTNPQHTPWSNISQTLYFDVPEHLRSKNEVVLYAYRYFDPAKMEIATTDSIEKHAKRLLNPSFPPAHPPFQAPR